MKRTSSVLVALLLVAACGATRVSEMTDEQFARYVDRQVTYVSGLASVALEQDDITRDELARVVAALRAVSVGSAASLGAALDGAPDDYGELLLMIVLFELESELAPEGLVGPRAAEALTAVAEGLEGVTDVE